MERERGKTWEGDIKNEREKRNERGEEINESTLKKEIKI